MKTRMILATVLALLLTPSAAQAVEVSPELQDAMNRQGWTASNTTAEEPYNLGDDTTKTCRYGRGKRVGFKLDGYNGPQVYLSQRLKVCAANGRITYMRCGTLRHGSPGGGWSNIYGPWFSHYRDNRQARCTVKIGWKNARIIDQFWDGRIDVGAIVRGDHDIRFPLQRRVLD